MQKSNGDNSILFHGEIISKKEAESYKFSVGDKFHFKNASYNDDFVVVSVRKDPGAEYRQIVGKVAGEVWMLLSSLQKEAALGSITFPTNNINSTTEKPKKEKVDKKTNKKKGKSKK